MGPKLERSHWTAHLPLPAQAGNTLAELRRSTEAAEQKQRAAEERTRAAQKLVADDAAAGQQAEREARDAKGQAQADKRATEALDAKAAT